jgi:hypothetical protein
MNKIPVGQTIRFAYDFTFGQIGTVIGLIWIPTLAYAVANFFLLGVSYPALAETLETGVAPTGGQAFLPFIPLLLSTVLLALVGVPITQQALGLRKGPAFAHFAPGIDELRVFGGLWSLYLLMVMLVFFLSLLVVSLAAGGAAVASAGAAPALILGVSVLCLAGFCALIYASVRLGFLLVPAALDGGGFGLTRSWELTKGNFWRIVAVALATMLPVFLVLDIADSIILGPQTADPGAAKDMAGLLRVFAGQLRAMQPHMPMLMGVNFLISPVLYGLLFAPAAFAYRVLSGKAAIEAKAPNP